MPDVPATNLAASYEALHGPIKWLAVLPDGTFIVVAVVFVLIALILRDTLAFVWASLCCLVVIGALGAKDYLWPIFILFVGASSLLVIFREKFATARNRHVLHQLDMLKERIDRLDFAVQNQFIRSLKDLKRPTIAPGIAPMDQAQNSEGTAHDAPQGAKH
jgi:hypothetical protein